MVDWAAHVNVPVFLSGALQDEQTGPQWTALIDAVPTTTPLFTNMVNGGHIDSAVPQTVSRWLGWRDLYVADKVPTQPSTSAALVLDDFASAAASVSSQVSLPALRFTTAPNLVTARSEFVTQTPRVHTLFDNGASSAGTGDIGSTPARISPAGPRPARSPTSTSDRTGVFQLAAVHARQYERHARPHRQAHDQPAGGRERVGYQPRLGLDTRSVGRRHRVSNSALQYGHDDRRPGDVGSVGEGTGPDPDFQATITEVQPPTGQEEYVTSGFLRSTNQVDAPDSTALFTDPTYLGSLARNLSPYRFSLVKIPIDPIVHTFRPGTELHSRDLCTRWGPTDLDLRDRRQWSGGNSRLRSRDPLGPHGERRLRREHDPNPSVVWLAAGGALSCVPTRGQPAIGQLDSPLVQLHRRHRVSGAVVRSYQTRSARSAVKRPGQPPEASCTLVLPAEMKGIIAARSCPTVSI